MSERRVVVTGIGIISPVGNDLDTFWKNLTEGRSGVTKYKAFDSTAYDCKIAGEVAGFDPTKYFQVAQGCPARGSVCAIRDGGCQDSFGRLGDRS